MENKISDKFLRKIKLFFVPDWVFLFATSSFLIYFSLIFYDRAGLFVSIITLSIFISKYFISQKIRTRLICKIQQDANTILLTIYNKSTITIDKSLIPLQKERRDYTINSLFDIKWGTIDLLPQDNDTSVVKIKGKKYYLIPYIFEEKVSI